jgi:ketosteroid isomerase-like protein
MLGGGGGSMRKLVDCALFVVLLLAVAQAQTTVARMAQPGRESDADVTEQISRLEQTWVTEFNAGHADKVAELYAPEAVLMRWDGSVHGSDSILAEMQRSIAAGTHGYVVHSLRIEHSGDLAYDTGAYNVTLKDRVVEGNYLVVAKRIGGQWKIVAHASVPNPESQ